jgi:predicted GH43/DUF377 family glycosyl hydrolase
MRQYCLGALFDLDDPSKWPDSKIPYFRHVKRNEKVMYPNVVYSCGSIIHNNSLILPYAVSDYSSTYGWSNMLELLDALKFK